MGTTATGIAAEVDSIQIVEDMAVVADSQEGIQVAADTEAGTRAVAGKRVVKDNRASMEVVDRKAVKVLASMSVERVLKMMGMTAAGEVAVMASTVVGLKQDTMVLEVELDMQAAKVQTAVNTVAEWEEDMMVLEAE